MPLWIFAIVVVVLIEVIIILIIHLREMLQELKDGEAINRDWADRFRQATEFKSLYELGFDPIECQELHLPGDCPLCGAT